MFSKRFNLFSFLGIPIGIDVSWFLIAILLTWTLASGHFPLLYPHLPEAHYWLMGLFGMLGLFVCILLHEIGHALIAKHYNIPVVQITLFIFGGVAELKKEAERPGIEFFIAIGGPLVSILLCIFFYAISSIGLQYAWPIEVIGITEYLAMINALLVLFNLIPAFPLDGGRILRSILWAWKKNIGWATKITTSLGSGFGIFLIVFGLLHFIAGQMVAGIWLAILGIFLQRAASISQTQFLIGRELKAEKASSFMKKEIDSVSSNMTIQELIEEHICRTHHQLYPVTEGKKLVGYISLRQIRSIDENERSSTILKQVMVPIGNFPTITPQTHALEALDLMQQQPIPTLLVVDGDTLVGLLTAHDLFKIISLKLELEIKSKR